MIKKLLIPVLILIGFVGGAVAGDKFGNISSDKSKIEEASQADTSEAISGEQHSESTASDKGSSSDHSGSNEKSAVGAAEVGWFQFPQQFFVPVVRDGQLEGTMILTLSVEMPEISKEEVYAKEIKLRDALLRQLLIHANTGGFDGNFTSEPMLRKLRERLLSSSKSVVSGVSDVLIGDIARQES